MRSFMCSALSLVNLAFMTTEDLMRYIHLDTLKSFVFMLSFALHALHPLAHACTGISLTSEPDNAHVVGRTVEWSLSDAQHYRIAVFPQKYQYTALTPEGATGMHWSGRYGFVSMTAYGQDYGPDGLNEKGLYVGMYYLPGFAEYQTFRPAAAHRSLSVGDFMQWMLSSFSTVAEVKRNIRSVDVVHVEDPRFGGAPLPFHWKVSDPSGESIVIEFTKGGNLQIFSTFLGVITNAPTYDWHLLNLRNYLHLETTPNGSRKIQELELRPFGAGSGMLGLPGDFTPPSRFIRAAAFTASVRPLKNAGDAVFEAFRILDSFNIPLGVNALRNEIPTDIESATQITSVADLTNTKYYYHTMFNRQVRMIDLTNIPFDTIKKQVLDDQALSRHEVRELHFK